MSSSTISLDYSKGSYWEQRYSDPSDPHVYEWYQSFDSLKQWIQPYFLSDTNQRILNVGCGSSVFGERLVEESDPFSTLQVVNIDYSPAVIERMNNKSSTIYLNSVRRECLQYLEMDATKMDFDDASFDCIFDKGTSDAILCELDPHREQGIKLLQEVSRVLKPGGYFAVVTCSVPRYRLPFLSKAEYNWVLVENIDLVASFCPSYSRCTHTKSSSYSPPCDSTASGESQDDVCKPVKSPLSSTETVVKPGSTNNEEVGLDWVVSPIGEHVDFLYIFQKKHSSLPTTHV